LREKIHYFQDFFIEASSTPGEYRFITIRYVYTAPEDSLPDLSLQWSTKSATSLMRTTLRMVYRMKIIEFTLILRVIISITFLSIYHSFHILLHPTGMLYHAGYPRFSGGALAIDKISRTFHCATYFGAKSSSHPFGDDIITSSSNEKVRLVKSLLTKKGRSRSGLILLEGHRTVLDALRAGAQPRVIMYTNKSLEAPLGPELSTRLFPGRSLPGNVWPSFQVTETVFATMSDTKSAQGVLGAFRAVSPDEAMPGGRISLSVLGVSDAIGNAASEVTPLGSLRSQSSTQGFAPLVVVLDGIADPGNMGTLLRTCYGMGATAVISVGEGCDVYAPKVLRAAMGVQMRATSSCTSDTGTDLTRLKGAAPYESPDGFDDIGDSGISRLSSSDGPVPAPMHIVECDDWGPVQDLLQRHRELVVPGSGPRKSGTGGSGVNTSLQVVLADGGDPGHLPYYSVDFTRPTVLVIGSEARGVSAAALRALRAVGALGAAVEAAPPPPATATSATTKRSGGSSALEVVQVRIPVSRPLESFNAAVAGSVLLGEAARQRSKICSGVTGAA
jgi:tRNA G18 (ribose-2'-O)-methylase SpoU